MTLFFSNQSESLAEELLKNLYKEGSSPFEKRFVIVPSRGMKFWLERWLAQKAIFFGVEVMPLDSALKKLLHKSYHLPTHIELLLAITALLKESTFTAQDPLFAEKIAHFFKRYSLYGYECFEKWEKGAADWQEKLWGALFGKEGPFIPLAKALQLEAIGIHSIHLFGLSHLPKPIFHFFSKINSFFYQHSFCQEFWSDILSDRELLSLQQEEEALLKFAEEWPPLLANFAFVMRKGLLVLEEASLIQGENYILPEGNSQLQRVQAHTLSFAKSQGIPPDASIQIHVATSHAREVEILHNRILQLTALENYKLHDILILASDIELYTPYLRALLPFPLTILDNQSLFKDSLVEALFLFLDLEKRRMSSSAIMELFSHPSFKKKQNFSEDDLQVITHWIEELHIRWGFDLAHKNKLMKHNEHPLTEEKNSFKEALERLIDSIPEEQTLVKVNQLELLYRFYDLIHRLYKDLVYFYEEEEKRPFSEYCSALERVATYYFFSETGESALQGSLAQLEAQAGTYRNNSLSFTQMYSLLRSTLLSTNSVVNQNGLNTILCSSLSTSSQLPYKVIYIMGIEEGVFPRKESSFSLDLLHKENLREYLPSKSDFDRGFFLEALFSVQERLLISYVETPSIILQEFVDALGAVTTYVHPHHSFDPSYFTTEDSNFRSFLVKEFCLAKAITTKQIEKKKEEVKKQEPFSLIEMKELLRFVKSPLKHTFKHRAGIYFVEESFLQEEEAFTLSPIESARIVRAPESLPMNVTTLKELGAFPQGNFGHIARSIVGKKGEAQSKLFAFHGVDPRELFTLKLDVDSLHVGPYTIVGNIDNVFKGGLLVHEKGTFAGALRAYPAFLALNIKMDAKRLIFGKDELSKERFFEKPEPLLIKLIELYLWARDHEALLFPELIEPILLKDRVLLTKSLEQLQANSYDEAFHFTYRYKPLPTATFLIESLHERVKECYQEFKDGWF